MMTKETRQKLTEAAKKPTVWGGLVTIATAIIFLANVYYDLKEDIKERTKDVEEQIEDTT